MSFSTLFKNLYHLAKKPMTFRITELIPPLKSRSIIRRIIFPSLFSEGIFVAQRGVTPHPASLVTPHPASLVTPHPASHPASRVTPPYRISKYCNLLQLGVSTFLTSFFLRVASHPASLVTPHPASHPASRLFYRGRRHTRRHTRRRPRRHPPHIFFANPPDTLNVLLTKIIKAKYLALI